MTAYLLLLVALGAADATVIYRDVPAEIARVRVYEWREGRAPVEFPAETNRDGDAVSIRGKPGALVIALFLHGADKYLLDGPFRWPATDGERTLDRRWRRSISMETRAHEPDDGPVEWLMSSTGHRRMAEMRQRQAAYHLLGCACRGSWSRVLPIAGSGLVVRRWQHRGTLSDSADWGRLLIVRKPARRIRSGRLVASIRECASAVSDDLSAAGAERSAWHCGRAAGDERCRWSGGGVGCGKRNS